MRSIAKWVLPVLVGPSTATIRDRPQGDASFLAMSSPYRPAARRKQACPDQRTRSDPRSAAWQHRHEGDRQLALLGERAVGLLYASIEHLRVATRADRDHQ